MQTELPEELNRYFADAEHFRMDDVEFRILSGGRVVIFHNRYNQIHNIMIDHPLKGEVTGEYEQHVAELMQEKCVDVRKFSRTKIPTADITEDDEKRFWYRISFFSKDDSVQITKTICNFFNGEKILSGGTWKEETEPSRIKDAFIRFENEQRRYACFIYFSKEEIMQVFEELYGIGSDGAEGMLKVTVGTKASAFEIEFVRGEKCFLLKQTEIRLYTIDEKESGKLILRIIKACTKTESDCSVYHENTCSMFVRMI